MMDFNVKKIVRDAGSAISRVVQLTEEKLGTSEKTELDSHFETLCERCDQVKQWTEKLIKDTEAVLIPNPSQRVEDIIFDKIEKKRPQRLSNLEYLGSDMIEAGNTFGQYTDYGKALIKIGQTEQKLGKCERDFINSAEVCYTQPLRKFIDGDLKAVAKERNLLVTKRLDLDACKNRVRKARTMLGQQTKDGIPPEVMVEEAERDLRIAQSEFDRQAEITKLLLEGIGSSQKSHLHYLRDFIKAQVRHYEQSYQIMKNLQSEMDLDTANTSCDKGNLIPCELEGHKKARVLCDYDAVDNTELSLIAGEEILVSDCNPVSSDFLMGHRNSRSGKVPIAFLEIVEC
ncbi:LOW QUALITY PROTEIN: endophilin-B1-like [Ctenocephalides felis]|uniref:LOW QUALITY PROTEIN: endophilin-B1-like n=1 Tax=Ctenocephalides felis TaxID=7515 RepID=UPI000E6E23B4|nr:LOW QUALITY PROTEIN: endophilin-B1-like [Ctenocephalides felis]